MAKIIYFLDPDFDRSTYDQVVGRIRRAGSKHSHLEAVMVISKETIHENICKFHLQDNKINLDVFQQAFLSNHQYELLPIITLNWDFCLIHLYRDKYKWIRSEEFIAKMSKLEITRVQDQQITDILE